MALLLHAVWPWGSWKSLSYSTNYLFLWNLKVHYSIHNSLPVGHILIQIKPMYILKPYLLMPIFILCSHLYLGLPHNVFPTVIQPQWVWERNPMDQTLHISLEQLHSPSFPLTLSVHSVGSDSLQQQLQLTHKWGVKQGSKTVPKIWRGFAACYFFCGLCVFCLIIKTVEKQFHALNALPSAGTTLLA